jgi:Kef-type K+ transport system membrane component KefB
MDNVYFIAAAWMGVAFLASLISIRVGVSVALLEIGLGIAARNFLGLRTTDWIDLLAVIGSVLLTFLAGAEIDPASLRRHLGRSLLIGSVSFALPAVAAFLVARLVIGWDLRASEIAAVALSTTSVAVVYAVMIESGLANEEIGKLILAACFVTDLGTVLALGALFADFNLLLALFVVVTAVGLVVLPLVLAWLVRSMPERVSEPEIKFVFLCLFGLGGLAAAAKSEAVLPAYLIGLAFAGVFVHSRVLVHRMRAIAFSLLTPFYFIKAGLLVSLPAVGAGVGAILVFLLVKVVTKAIGVWPAARISRLPIREANYTTLLMSTGLTFGSIAALFGLTNGLIDQTQYTILVTTVILSAVIPTLIATTFFEPHIRGTAEQEEVEAAEEIDAGPLRHPVLERPLD